MSPYVLLALWVYVAFSCTSTAVMLEPKPSPHFLIGAAVLLAVGTLVVLAFAFGVVKPYVVLALWAIIALACIYSVATLETNPTRHHLIGIAVIFAVGTLIALAVTFGVVRQILNDFQAAIGAIIGLFGLAWVALWNADLQRQRDDRLYAREQRAVAKLVAAQLTTLGHRAEMYGTSLETGPEENREFLFTLMINDPSLMSNSDKFLSELKVLPVVMIALINEALAFLETMKAHYPIGGYRPELPDDNKEKTLENTVKTLKQIVEIVDFVGPILILYAETGELPAE